MVRAIAVFIGGAFLLYFAYVLYMISYTGANPFR